MFSSTNINSIDETDIINYFKGKVQKGIENLTKQINISIKKTQKALEEARTIQRHPTMLQILFCKINQRPFE